MVITNREGALRKDTNDTMLILYSFQKQNRFTFMLISKKKNLQYLTEAWMLSCEHKLFQPYLLRIELQKCKFGIRIFMLEIGRNKMNMC